MACLGRTFYFAMDLCNSPFDCNSCNNILYEDAVKNIFDAEKQYIHVLLLIHIQRMRLAFQHLLSVFCFVRIGLYAGDFFPRFQGMLF